MLRELVRSEIYRHLAAKRNTAHKKYAPRFQSHRPHTPVGSLVLRGSLSSVCGHLGICTSLVVGFRSFFSRAGGNPKLP